MPGIVPDPRVRVCGTPGLPVSGAVTVREFGGSVELCYRAREVRETEKLNGWLREAGMDTVYSAYPKTYGGVDQPAPEPPTPEDNLERSVRRAKQRVRWSIKAIQADRLLTLTHRENLGDFDASRKVVDRFTAWCRREWPSWRMVGIPERQERGAWHWHLAVPGWVNVDKLRGFWWRAHKRRVVFSDGGKPVLANGGETPGNVDIRAAKKRRRAHGKWDIASLAGYLSKYMGKAMGALDLDGRARYIVSRGIEWRVTRFYMHALTFDDVVSGLIALADDLGAVLPPWWCAPDRKTIWAAAVLGEPPPVQ